jgi:hypothetical protein
MVQLTGELQTLQSTKGDLVKIKVDGIDHRYSLLSGFPADGTDIEDYKDLFKQRVAFTAEISHKTPYKRPELIIIRMEPEQEQLDVG